MLAMQYLYKALNPEGVATLVSDDVSKLSNQVIEKLSPSSEILRTSDQHHDLVIILDTNSRYQLGNSVESLLLNPSSTLVIDHHEMNPNLANLAEHTIIRSDISSTCEIVFELFKGLGIQVIPEIANLLLTGMIFDTRRFFYSGATALTTALELIEAGANYSHCLNSLISKPSRSERIARLKAAGRCKVHLLENWVVVTSKINAFEASACRGLIELGADVAIVGGKTSKGEVRLSARSTNKFSSETGINLGSDIMEPLGSLVGGHGGGHANAAGANGTMNRDAALERSVELISEELSKGNKTHEGHS
ncbi:bifunctional oligoribonuclease/PAP phosphatase NrnA [Candidatus Thorarchaeota archaeon]|nr:MAG: bifunctional oligoribonuclease/PAP phosphatase NrnA [Candidatus Thorarchaeota archaeon]